MIDEDNFLFVNGRLFVALGSDPAVASENASSLPPIPSSRPAAEIPAIGEDERWAVICILGK
jgi:hypothetical protein